MDNETFSLEQHDQDTILDHKLTPEEEEALNEEIEKIVVDEELEDIITKDQVDLDLHREEVQNCFLN